MRSVPLETAKQLDFKMKFMGLAVVFMVLNVLSPAASAPAPFDPISASLLGAGAGGLVAAKIGAVANPLAAGAAAIATALPAGFVTGTLLPAKLVAAKGLTLIAVGAGGLALLEESEE